MRIPEGWYIFNDMEVRQSSFAEIDNENTYILSYKKKMMAPNEVVQRPQAGSGN